MPNEVNITITARDLTGPAFASALAKMEALKRAGGGINFFEADPAKMNQSLMMLKSKIQSLGIADIADINVQPGKIMSQLQLLKRMVNQSGITDLMDVNINSASLAAQMAKLSGLSETIPVNFAVSKIPQFGTIMPIHVPVSYNVSNIPQFGNVSAINAAVRAEQELQAAVNDVNKAAEQSPFFWDKSTESILKNVAASKAATEASNSFIPPAEDVGSLLDKSEGYWDDNFRKILNYSGALDQGTKYNSFFATSLNDILTALPLLASHLDTAKFAASAFFGAIGAGALTALAGATGALSHFNDNVSRGIPMWQSAGNLWFGLGGHISLFGGALNNLLPAWIATASGLHLLVDGVIEVGATLIPAALGIAAFAAGAVDSVNEIQQHFQNMDKVIDMTGQGVYPLTGAFSRMNAAVQPEVYVLLGEGLIVANKNAGLLQTTALAAGHVLDQLGARFTYAMTQGSGFGGFMKNSASDLAGWGNLIGNIGGILGNFFKVMPGYAEVILNVANAVTNFAENITGSALGEKLIGIGLAAHGAFLYIGLLGTGAALIAANTLSTVAAAALQVGIGFDKIGATGAATAMAKFASGAEQAAALPWGWITIAAAGIGFLVYQLVNAKSAAYEFAQGVQTNLVNGPLNTLGSRIGTTLVNALKSATDAQFNFLQMAGQTGYFDTAINKTEAQKAALAGLAQQYADMKQVIIVASQDQVTYNANLDLAAKALGGTKNALAALSGAGITSAQMLTTSKQQMAENIIEAQGYEDALKSLALGTGQYAAAMNALSGPEQFLGDMLKSIQAITQAQDNLISVVTTGQATWDTFALGTATLENNLGATSKAAGTASHSLEGITSKVSLVGAAMGGTTQADYQLNQAFYAQVQNGQKVIDALEQQEASTKNLTTATATIASQMIPFAGNNTAARATIVALINDALGPATVNLKDLNSWVKNNSTSLSGMNSIIAQSTIKAGQLANVLQTQLTAQFQADLLKSSGATQQMKLFTDAIVNGGDQTNAYKSARQKLIDDLENTGLSAQSARQYVNNLQGQINQMHGKSVSVIVTAAGNGNITFNENTGVGSNVTGGLKFMSGGGKLPGFGGGDQWPALLESGETVIDKNRTRMLAGLFSAMGVKGFSGGGLIGNMGAPENFMGSTAGSFSKNVSVSFMEAVAKAAEKAFKAAAIGDIKYSLLAGVTQWENTVAHALSMEGLAASLLPHVMFQMQTESGGNPNAINNWDVNAQNGDPSRGLMQVIMTTFEAYHWPGTSNNIYDPLANIAAALNYADHVYGPTLMSGGVGIGSGHGYSNGGATSAGWSILGEHGRELVKLPGGATVVSNGGTEAMMSGGGGGASSVILGFDRSGSSAFEVFMVEAIRKWVKIKGGGNVQRAFGQD